MTTPKFTKLEVELIEIALRFVDEGGNKFVAEKADEEFCKILRPLGFFRPIPFSEYPEEYIDWDKLAEIKKGVEDGKD